MDLTRLEDNTLIERAAARERDAFEELYNRHASVVLGVLVRMLKRRELAEEILQEAFLQAWLDAGRFRPERGVVRAWLITIARSRALDRLRSAQSRTRREQSVGEEAARVAAPVGTANLETEERRRRVRAAMKELPAAQRTCLELAYFEGLTHRELAERLGEPLGTVKSRILLGMNKLRGALAP